MDATPGHFIALDGPDGGGKSTHLARVAAWLTESGRDVVTCRDPGGTPLGDRLRALVMGRDQAAIGMRAEMLLYMASRAQLVEEVIRPATEMGKIVLSDRFLLANMVYQGVAGGLDPAEILRVGLAATGGLLPDLTIVLDVPAEVANARTGGARDRIEDRPDAYKEAVRAGFRDAPRLYPAPVVVLDACGDIDETFHAIRAEVSRALGTDPRR